MVVTSRFRRNVAGPIVILLMIVGLSVLITYLWSEEDDAPYYALLAYYIPAVMLAAMMVFGELRKRTIKVTVDRETITVRRYLGWGREELHFLNSFDGFYTTNLQAEEGAYEYLYLMKDNKKVIKLSEFYHANFQEIKSAIKGHVKDQGPLAYNFWREVREFFD